MGYVLVTASGKGIGLAIAKYLSSLDFNIIVTSKTVQSLEYAKQVLGNIQKHKFFQVDFENDIQVKSFLDEIQSLPIISIVHNLGKRLEMDQHPIEKDVFYRTVNLNFLISIEINNKLQDHLQGKPSKIIYVGSNASLHCKASPCYVLSKSLIDAYVKNSAAQYLEKNIVICGVLPGIVLHNGSDWDKKRIEQPQIFEKVRKEQPLEQFLTPYDIAEYIGSLLLVKSHAIAGTMIKLDAGAY